MNRISIVAIIALSFLLVGNSGMAADQTNFFQLRVRLPKRAGSVLSDVGEVFKRSVEARSKVKVVSQGRAPLTVELAVETGIGKEGFRITDGPPDVIRITGNDERGVLYGVGKFLRTSRYENGFTPSTWRGFSVPEKPVRGIYLATHFYNYYQTAPIEEVEIYIEELALWGVNSVLVWYDMHHFKGFNDPEAVAFRARLKRILQAARKARMGIGLLVIGNEAYDDSPKNLRADPSAQRGGYYDVAICPSKPGSLEYSRKVMGELFDWASDLQPEYVCIWPYDQGSCGCDLCRPWGANGFLKCVESTAKLAKNKLPGVKIIISTWYLDERERQGLRKALSPKPDWADSLLTEDVRFAHQGIAGMPVIGFPEISMGGMFPWGGFGANPQPAHFRKVWDEVKQNSAGGYPYSEGKFEDINKVLWAQMYWNSTTPASETLKEYIAYEFSPEVVDELQKVIATIEKNHHFRWWPGELEGVKLQMNWFPSRGMKPQADPGAEDAYTAIKRADAKLPQWAHDSWRWRILYLRALLDSELKTNGGKPNAACEQAMRELCKIYGLTDKADPVIRPPVTPE